jgi:7,8-dihydroneopterin aldolase/epimerase/oxygenase
LTDPLYSGDRVFLRGLTAECIIGFIDWERRVRQTVVIDLEVPVDCRRAAATDEVADTVDYKKVAITLLEEFGLEWVRLEVNKPGAIRNSRDVGVRIERNRADLTPAAASRL